MKQCLIKSFCLARIFLIFLLTLHRDWHHQYPVLLSQLEILWISEFLSLPLIFPVFRNFRCFLCFLDLLSLLYHKFILMLLYLSHFFLELFLFFQKQLIFFYPCSIYLLPKFSSEKHHHLHFQGYFLRCVLFCCAQAWIHSLPSKSQVFKYSLLSSINIFYYYLFVNQRSFLS